MYRVRVLATAALLAACTQAAGAPSDDLLSLYAQARGDDPGVQRAAALAHAADAGADVERGALLPHWTLSATPQRSAGVSSNVVTSKISQALIDLAALSNWRAARAEAKAQQATLHVAGQTLLAGVAVRYFALLTAQHQLSTLSANEAAFAELVRQSEVRVAERLSAPVDVDQARAFLGLAQGATQQAIEALADARQALQQLTGRPPLPLRPLRQDLRPIAPQPAEAQAWVDEALARHPLLQAGSAKVDAAAARVDAARAANLPTLSLAVTTVRGPLDGLVISAPGTHTGVGLQLTVPLFAGGAAFGQQKQARYAREAEAAQLEATRRDLVRNVQAQWQAARGSVTQVATAEAGALAAERALAATRAGNEHGTRSLTDVLNAIQTNGQARLQFIQARHRYVVALLLLKQAAGRLSVDDLANVNALLESEPQAAARQP